MSTDQLFEKYRELQQYVAWSDEDEKRLRTVAGLLEPTFGSLVDDFYQEILQHSDAARVITGGTEQVERLKVTLRQWLNEAIAGPYDANYVERRVRIGLRHVQIGLDQAYTNVALSRLRNTMARCLAERWPHEARDLALTIISLNKILDLDLTIIQRAYESERLRLQGIAQQKRSDATFGNLVESAECAIVILRNDNTITYFSPFAERLTGHAQKDVLNSDYGLLFAEQAETFAVEKLLVKARAGEPVLNCELTISCSDGRKRLLVWNARRLDDYDGDSAVLAVGHDITEMRRATERLRVSERLAAIGQTVTGLAHESRNSLQRIHSCTELLEYEVEDNEEAMHLIRRSRKAQDDLHRLFDEVRNYAAPVTLEKLPCDMASIWREAWGLLQRERSGRDASLTEQLGNCDRNVRVDRFRLVQVFRNLLENALVACTDPVKIEVACREIQDEGRGGSLEIRVTDNGPGLAPEIHDRVFQPFVTTKTKGTGLGMAIAERIIHAHDGDIWAEGSDRPGAQFVILLPRE